MPAMYFKLDLPKDLNLAREILDGDSAVSFSWDKGDPPRLVARLPHGVGSPVRSATLCFDVTDPDALDALRASLDGPGWQRLVHELIQEKLRPFYKHSDNQAKADLAGDTADWIFEEAQDRNLRLPR